MFNAVYIILNCGTCLEVVSKPHLTPKYGVASFLEMYAHPAAGGTALSKKLAPCLWT